MVLEKNQEIGNYIDDYDLKIDQQTQELKGMIKDRKELKYRIQEIRGNLASMTLEKERLQFESIKLELD